jgi:hypothetical protein
MARPPTLSFDRGTLLLYPPPPGKAWIGVVKLTFSLAPLLPHMPYSPHESTTSQLV